MNTTEAKLLFLIDLKYKTKRFPLKKNNKNTFNE